MYQSPSFLCFPCLCQRDLPSPLLFTAPSELCDEFCSVCSLLQEQRQSLQQNEDIVSEGRAVVTSRAEVVAMESSDCPGTALPATELRSGCRQLLHHLSSWKMGIERFGDNVWPPWDFSTCWPCLSCCGVSLPPSRISPCSHHFPITGEAPTLLQ